MGRPAALGVTRPWSLLPRVQLATSLRLEPQLKRSVTPPFSSGRTRWSSGRGVVPFLLALITWRIRRAFALPLGPLEGCFGRSVFGQSERVSRCGAHAGARQEATNEVGTSSRRE